MMRRRVAQCVVTRWRSFRRVLDLPDVRAGLQQGVLLGAAMAVVVLPPSPGIPRDRPHPVRASAPSTASHVAPPVTLTADFRAVQPSPDVRRIADWIAASADNGALPFVVLDKRRARLYVFDRRAGLVGSSMVLLGSAVGDDTPPGVGTKHLSEIRAHERITPAGRFVSEPGHDDAGNDLVWVDYDAAVAMHRVQVIDPREKRFERIATPFVDDKRISNGCINVPIPFFDTVVKPTIGRTHAVVYIIPDVRSIRQVFPAAYTRQDKRRDTAL